MGVLAWVWRCLRGIFSRALAPVSTPVDGAVPVPERWEYKVLLMLVPGERDLAYLSGTLWSDFRTLRGAIPEKGKHTLRALLHPMLARGWVQRVDKGNPGVWVYAITTAGYDALKRSPPLVAVWQPEAHTREAQDHRALQQALARAFARARVPGFPPRG